MTSDQTKNGQNVVVCMQRIALVSNICELRVQQDDTRPDKKWTKCSSVHVADSSSKQHLRVACSHATLPKLSLGTNLTLFASIL